MKSKKLSAIDQPELKLARTPEKAELPLDLILKQKSMAGAIALCVQASGLDDKEVYLTLDVDPGHWSRIMKGDAHFPVNKLNDLMNMCGNESPLQWLANARGYGLVMLRSEAERRAEDAELRAKDAEEKLAFLTKIMQGKASA